jgi:O-antigen biosynthesis protein
MLGVRSEPRIHPADVEGYRAWVRANDDWQNADGAWVSSALARLTRRPLLAAVLLDDGLASLRSTHGTVRSILAQSYPDWELWLPSLRCSDAEDARLRRVMADEELRGVRWFNRVLATTTGEYLVPVPSDAVLAPHALLELAIAIAVEVPPVLVYSDEDRYDASGLRMAPSFKPGWDPELMLGRDVVGNLSAYRMDRLRDLGGADERLPTQQAYLYELSLKITEGAQASVSHIPRILCSTPLQVLQPAGLDGPMARSIVGAHLIRRGAGGAAVVPVDRAPAWTHVEWPIPNPAPLVSVVVPTRDQPDILARCAAGVLHRTEYPRIELVIVDNGSVDERALAVMQDLAGDERVRLIRDDRPFNYSALNNAAARRSSGDVLVLLNDDTEVIHPGWLRELVSLALRPEIGIAGARLLYPDGRIQHAGIVMETGGAEHQFRFSDAAYLGPNGELALTRSVSAVTAACIALRREVFEKVSGLDEDLVVAYSDVDLCLRVRERGYRIVCSPFAELYHHESATRGYEDTPEKRERFISELDLMMRRWSSTGFMSEAFANPNLRFSWDDEGAWGLPHAAAVEQSQMQSRGRSRSSAFARRMGRAWRAIASSGPLLSMRVLTARLVPNPLFSSSWYLASYPDATHYRLGSYQHYRRHGVADGRNPNHLFDTRWYLLEYPDVPQTKINPLDHYLYFGAAEGRDPSPRFSSEGYLAANPDVRDSGQNPLLHYLRHGAHERRPLRSR